MKRQFKAITKDYYTVVLTAGPPGTNGSFWSAYVWVRQSPSVPLTPISQMFKSSPVFRHKWCLLTIGNSGKVLSGVIAWLTMAERNRSETVLPLVLRLSCTFPLRDTPRCSPSSQFSNFLVYNHAFFFSFIFFCFSLFLLFLSGRPDPGRSLQDCGQHIQVQKLWMPSLVRKWSK